MADIIDFEQKKLEAEPHTAGPMSCLSCKHEWIGVVPVGVSAVECPKCGLIRGTHKYIALPEDGITWVCGCGNNLFVISAKGNAICVGCGQHQRIPEC